MISKTVMVDIDGVLCDLHSTSLRYIKEQTGVVYDYKNLLDEPIDSKDELLHSHTIDFLNQPELVVKCPPFAKARTALSALKSQGYEIHVASARRSALHDATYQWLDINGMLQYIDEVHYRADNAEKLKFKHLVVHSTQPAAIFEDNGSVIESYKDLNVPVYLIQRPWNAYINAGGYIHSFTSFYRAVMSFVGIAV